MGIFDMKFPSIKQFSLKNQLEYISLKQKRSRPDYADEARAQSTGPSYLRRCDLPPGRREKPSRVKNSVNVLFESQQDDETRTRHYFLKKHSSRNLFPMSASKYLNQIKPNSHADDHTIGRSHPHRNLEA